jgi:FkbM family methyltransferase
MDLSYLSKDNQSHSLVLKYIDYLKPGDTFIDIGANIGFFSAIAAQKVGPSGKVFSFEPSPREYQRLLFTISKNNLSNIIIPFNLALADCKEILSLVIAENHTGINSLQNSSHMNNLNYTKVFTTRLDDLIEEKIKLVKIDVEGAEYRVLKGMETLLNNGKIDTLIVEITPMFLKKFGSTKDELYQYLEQKKFHPNTLKNEEWQYDEVFSLEKTNINTTKEIL